MAYKIIITPEAENDFDQIESYLRENDFDSDILNKIKAEISKKLSEKPASNRRSLDDIYMVQILRKNVVYYRIHDNFVRILQVRAGGMDNRY